MAESRVWFITGTSSGFGRLMTEYLLKQGDRVVATLRKPEVLADLVNQYPSTRLLVVKLDVTQHAEIPAAFAKAQEAFGRIDIVLNNAGKALNGELESVNEEDARDLFDTNFWGAVRVTREAVRFFREVNQPQGGRLLQMSSSVAISGFPCCGHYSASKFALEGLTEALASEIDPAWNIKITMLEPGPFLTEILTVNHYMVTPHPAYTDPELPGSKLRANFRAGPKVLATFSGDPQKACVAFEKASRLENPPIRLPLLRSALDQAHQKGKELIEIAEKYKAWSDDLYF